LLHLFAKRLRQIPLDWRYQASPQILPGPLLVDFLEQLLALRAAVRLTMTGGVCRGISPNALVHWFFSIRGREVNFKLMDLIPLGVGASALRYGQKLLQASAWGHRLRCVHDAIIPSFSRGPVCDAERATVTCVGRAPDAIALRPASRDAFSSYRQ
jgi:hypothetical protein